MQYFKDAAGAAYGYATAQVAAGLADGLVPMTALEVYTLFNPTPSAEQLAATAHAAAQAYLTSTDWYVVRQFERGVPTPEAVAAERARCVEVLNE